MARVKLTGPDGRSAWLSVPETASEEDIRGAIAGAMQSWPKGEEKPMGWGEVATSAVQNIPKSAMEFGGNIVHAVTHPIETVKAVADVGYGGLSKAAGAVGVPMDTKAKAEREQSFDAVAGFFADRYGGVENLKKTLADDPVGFAADVSAVLLPANIAARAPGVTGKVAQTVSAVGRAVDPVNAAAKAVKATGRNVVAPAVGMLTGAGAEPIRAAARAGQQGNRVLLDNMRGNAGINDTLDMASNALGQIKQQRSAAYKADMDGINKSRALVNLGPVDEAISAAREKTNVNGFVVDDVASKTVDDIAAKFDEFRNVYGGQGRLADVRTPAGLDALKQSIGEIRQRTQPNTLARNVADQVYHSVKNEIVRQVPGYAGAMKNYSQASDRINDLTKTFSLGERAAPDTTARKLQSVMRNNVNTNYGRRTKLMDELAQLEPDLPAALAGQQLSSWTPRGLQALGATGAGLGAITHLNPTALAALPFMSPRTMGEVAYGVGRGTSLVGEGARKAGIDVSRLPPWILALYEAGALNEAAQNGLLGGP